MRARVPCHTSVLVLILVTQMSMTAFLWDGNRTVGSASLLVTAAGLDKALRNLVSAGPVGMNIRTQYAPPRITLGETLTVPPSLHFVNKIRRSPPFESRVAKLMSAERLARGTQDRVFLRTNLNI